MVKPAYLLDTNMWIFVLKGKNEQLVERLSHTDPDAIALCSVVKAELWHGAHRYGNPERRVELLRSLFARHQSLAFDDGAAEIYGEIRYNLESSGKVIGPMDMIIAAIAIQNELTLVTNNTKEFARVDMLDHEDWAI